MKPSTSKGTASATEKMSYLLGALRDASIDIRQGKNYEVKIGQKDVRWLQYLQNLFSELFDDKGGITPHGNSKILRITKKAVVQKVLEVSEMKVPQDKWNTPSFVLNASDIAKMAYVRGFWDAEGGLPTTTNQNYISFDQKYKPALRFVRETLKSNGFHPTNMTFTGECWQFRITRRNEIARYFREVGTSHPEKLERFRRMMGILFP